VIHCSLGKARSAPHLHRRVWRSWLVCAALAAAGAACTDGGGDIGVVPDAGTGDKRSLTILDPPGEEIGLSYSSRITLYVRYQHEGGGVIRGQEVRFALEANRPGESTAGATLSATTTVTDSVGEASVELFSGAQDARFRLSVDARNASTVYFFVSVAQGGFAAIDVEPTHVGWRAAEDLARVEVRLYASAFVSCDTLDIDAPPNSAYPPRGLDGFGAAVSFQNVTARQPHTVVAWAQTAGSATPVAVGCLPLDGAQLPPSRVRTTLPVRDRDPILPAALPVFTTLDLAPVAAAVEAAGATAAWDVLACPAGPGQLLLDCALDAAAPDDALDCVAGGRDALVDAVAAQRGPIDGSGCRSLTRADGASSLDARLTEAVAEDWPTGAALDSLLLARARVAAALVVDSVLMPLGPGAVAHHLTTARVLAGDQPFALDLAATSRPVIAAMPVGTALDGNLLTLAPHGFTLRYAAIATSAFAALGLTPAGVTTDARALGQALAAAVRDASGDAAGCAALSRVVCAAIGEGTSCLAAACEDAIPAMDTALAAWIDAVDGSAAGLDFELAGTAVLLDLDGDLVVDGLGVAERAAEPWHGHLTLGNGQVVEVPAGL
jgi:hypothetical protein